jgi:hypothetical protein
MWSSCCLSVCVSLLISVMRLITSSCCVCVCVSHNCSFFMHPCRIKEKEAINFSLDSYLLEVVVKMSWRVRRCLVAVSIVSRPSTTSCLETDEVRISWLQELKQLFHIRCNLLFRTPEHLRGQRVRASVLQYLAYVTNTLYAPAYRVYCSFWQVFVFILTLFHDEREHYNTFNTAADDHTNNATCFVLCFIKC